MKLHKIPESLGRLLCLALERPARKGRPGSRAPPRPAAALAAIVALLLLLLLLHLLWSAGASRCPAQLPIDVWPASAITERLAIGDGPSVKLQPDDWRAIPFVRAARIPRHLLQTWPPNPGEDGLAAIPPVSRRAMATWSCLNPGLLTGLITDGHDFVARHFGADVAARVEAFPVSAMRSDFLRYALLHVHGGIYADLDAPCLRPLESWFPPPRASPKELPRLNLGYTTLPSWDACSLVVAVERGQTTPLQWAIASVPGHPVLRRALELVLERTSKDMEEIYTANRNFVHFFTGPDLWRDAVLEVMGVKNCTEVACAFRQAWLDPEVHQRAVRELGVCLMDGRFWQGGVVDHLATSFVKDGDGFLEEAPHGWRAEMRAVHMRFRLRRAQRLHDGKKGGGRR